MKIEIEIPEGYEIDKEKSSPTNIIFKKIEVKRFIDITTNLNEDISGYWINNVSTIVQMCPLRPNEECNYNIFASEKYALSALAYARLSMIIKYDKRFGGPVTDQEWASISIVKYVIERVGIILKTSITNNWYSFLAFHTAEQRKLFYTENFELIKQYYML